MVTLTKTACIHIRVIFEELQQIKQNYEELESFLPLMLEIESLLTQATLTDRHAALMAMVTCGLELVHEGLKKLDLNFGKLLFRPHPLMEKLYRFLQKMVYVLQQVLGPIYVDQQNPASGQQNGVLMENGVQVVIEFNTVDTLYHPTAKEFWLKNFGDKASSVEWDSFKSAFEKELGPQTPENLKRLKKLLGCDASNEMVSIFEFGDFTDTNGLEASYSRLLMRASSTLTSFVNTEMQALSPESSHSDPDMQSAHSPPRVDDDDEEFEEGHPIDANTVWTGVCTERGCEVWDMTLYIIEKEEGNIKGKIFWSGEVQTKFKGTVKDNMIHFEEYKVIKGINIIPFPNSYDGTLDEKMVIISGKWHAQEQQGSFQLHYDREASNSLITPRSTTEDDIQYAGILSKQSTGLTKKWQQRWFVLEHDVLSYCKTKEGFPRKIKGSIHMDQVISVQNPNDGSRPTLFEIITQERTYHLQAEDMESKAKWLEALRSDVKKFEQDSSDIYNI